MTSDARGRRDAVTEHSLRQMASDIVPVEDPERAAIRRARVVPQLSVFADEVFLTAPKRSVRPAIALAALVAAAAMVVAVGVRVLRGGREIALVSPNPTLRVSAGPVRIFHAGAPEPASDRVLGPLTARDRVETGEGHAEVSLASGAVVELGSKSELELGSVDRTEGAFSERIDVGAGRISVRVPKLPPGGRLMVGTPQALVTVHGTAFVVEVRRPSSDEPAMTTVSVTEGRVSVASGGREIFLDPGSQWTSSPPPQIIERSATVEPAAPGRRAPAGPAPKSTLPEENELFRAALSARRGGDPRGAIALFDRLLAVYPTTPLGSEARAERERARADLASRSAP